MGKGLYKPDGLLFRPFDVLGDRHSTGRDPQTSSLQTPFCPTPFLTPELDPGCPC